MFALPPGNSQHHSRTSPPFGYPSSTPSVPQPSSPCTFHRLRSGSSVLERNECCRKEQVLKMSWAAARRQCFRTRIFFKHFFFPWCIFFLEVESGFVIRDGSDLFEGPLFVVPESQPSVSFAPCLSFEGRVVNLVLGFCCGCCRRSVMEFRFL